ncbi:hypothetical protein Bca4012_046484 [Brassica carinata]
MDGGGGVGAGCIRIKYLSPRRVMARLFPSPVKVKGKKKKAMAEERVRNCDCERIINDHHGVGQLSDSPPRTIDSELRRREFLFSIGMSCYLLHLIATGREEIHKIVELRNDIEKLLECKNDEMRRKHQEFAELRNEIDKLLQNHNDDLRRKQQRFVSGKQEQSDAVETSSDYYYSPQLPETSLAVVGVRGEGSFKHYVVKGKGEDFGGDMDQLEAELEAEFELLQIGHNQEKNEDSRGIRPLEEQQGKRLHVKEAEASWWKDTACIVSEHVPQPSRINPNSQTRQYPLSRIIKERESSVNHYRKRVLKLPSPIRFFLQAQVKMQAVIRSFVSGGNVVRSSLLQHLRVVNPAIQPSVLSTRSESTQPARMEEHGFESTTISDVMNAKGKSADGSWLWCTTDDSVYDAVKSMTQHNVGALVVVKPGEQQSLAGIITERDYLRKIIVQGRSSKSTKVGDIMTEENKLITVTPETKVLVAMQLMTDNRIRHIPVIKDKGMIGMVSIGDVVRAVVTEHREELNRLNAFIQGGY